MGCVDNSSFSNFELLIKYGVILATFFGRVPGSRKEVLTKKAIVKKKHTRSNIQTSRR